MMNVENLFDCFTAYFNKILFYDRTNNTRDTVYIEQDGDFFADKYDEFLEEYGDYEVTDWEYVYHGNYIDITIEE